MNLAFRRLATFTVAGAAWLAISACGAAPAGKNADRTIPVKVRDFRITAPKRVPAGDVTFAMNNEGPVLHELIVVRDTERKLPLRGDNITVDEDGLGKAVAGALEPQLPGLHRLKVKLTPGHYYLLCNMSGHYLGGMETEIVAG